MLASTDLRERLRRAADAKAAELAQEREEQRLRDMRSRKPMTHTTKGLGEQIEAARAQARHVQDAALAERRREKELAATQDEARRSRSRVGG